MSHIPAIIVHGGAWYISSDQWEAHKGGLILIDRAGRVGFAYNTSQMARAYMLEGMSQPEVGI